MYATKLTLLITAIVLYVAGSIFWFFWQVPELLSTGTDQTLVAAFAGTGAWMLLTFDSAAYSGRREVVMQAEILSDDELADLTGYKHRAHQRKWLKDRNWVYVESRGGRPLVGRMFARMKLGLDVPLGKDLDKARLKWAELEAKDKPADLTTMKGIFDRYVRDVIPKKGERTQKDNLAELKQLRPMFDEAPIDSITPASIAGYRDARTAKVRANREIALLSHVFNIAREWGLTERENPCQGVRKNKETPRDYYANAVVWDAVYGMAGPELREAMDLGYLTGQRPADVIAMRSDDVDGDYFL
eukprot:gene18156-18009_t